MSRPCVETNNLPQTGRFAAPPQSIPRSLSTSRPSIDPTLRSVKNTSAKKPKVPKYRNMTSRSCTRTTGTPALRRAPVPFDEFHTRRNLQWTTKKESSREPNPNDRISQHQRLHKVILYGRAQLARHIQTTASSPHAKPLNEPV